MDVVYSNLENYDTENISELRNENNDLKCKLEEYASTLGNLQKDFDKLSSEYKKLELNYSSLLKTARAEIDRKTKMITKLNLEKDQLIINSMLNKGRLPPAQILHKIDYSQLNMQKTENEVAEVTNVEMLKNDKSASKLMDKIKSSTHDNERNKQDKTTSSLPSLGSTGQVDPRLSNDIKEREQKLKIPQQNRDSDRSKIESKEDKFSHKDGSHVDNDEVEMSKIKHRRKSMPLLNRADFKFSSDEEEESKSKDPRCRRRSPVRDLHRKNHDRDHNGRVGLRESEYTRFDDKFMNYHDLSRDYHKNSRYGESDKYRSRDNMDKYETNQRCKKYYGPDRFRYNTYREYSMDKPQWPDYVRHRISESSPPKYNPMRRNRDVDRHWYQKEEICGIKHKLHDVMEEPAHKRMRSKSVNRPSYDHVTLQQEKEVNFYAARTLEPEYPSSLQSPDYANSDSAASVHKIKEIKATATIKLDDPRLMSNKYKVNSQKGKVELSTVVGRDVDIKCVDTSEWNMDKTLYKMPTPLREKPHAKELLNEILIDVHQPISNLSLEQGEIESSEEATRPLVKDIFDNPYNNLNVINTDTINLDLHLEYDKSVLNNVQNKDTKMTNQSDILVENNDNREKKSSDFVCDNHTISKADKSITNKSSKVTITNSIQKLGKRDSNKQSQKRKTDREKRDVEKREKKEEFHSHNEDKAKYNFRSKKKNENNFVANAIISARDTVACDLELSDETSDNCELPDKPSYDTKNIIQGDNSTKKPVSDDADKNKNVNRCSSHVSNQNDGLKHESLSENKHISTPKLFSGIQPKEVINKMSKEPTSKDIKTKICDLFGESSSLISPDDLGIPEPSNTKDFMCDYSPLFDNTQDAVDLNVKDMEKVQAQSLKLKLEDTSVSNGQQDDKPEKKQKSRSTKKDEKKKKHKNNIEKSTGDHISENVNVPNYEPEIVKTVIISTGVQNNSEEVVPETVQEKFPISSKGNNDTLGVQASSSLIALATSTPHKTIQIEPSTSVPKISASSTDVSLKYLDNTSSNMENFPMICQTNSDVPDVRIIIKRRRKTKAT